MMFSFYSICYLLHKLKLYHDLWVVSCKGQFLFCIAKLIFCIALHLSLTQAQ